MFVILCAITSAHVHVIVNVILDVHNLEILNPRELEATINNLAGVVTNGIFSLRGADVVLCASGNEVKTFS